MSQAARVQGRLDLILGSDILYERDEGGALAGYMPAVPSCTARC